MKTKNNPETKIVWGLIGTGFLLASTTLFALKSDDTIFPTITILITGLAFVVGAIILIWTLWASIIQKQNRPLAVATLGFFLSLVLMTVMMRTPDAYLSTLASIAVGLLIAIASSTQGVFAMNEKNG